MQSETRSIAARSIDKRRGCWNSCFAASGEVAKVRRRASDASEVAAASFTAFTKSTCMLYGGESDLRRSLSCDSVLFTDGNEVSSEARGVANREEAFDLEGPDDRFEDSTAVFRSLDVLAAVPRVAEALFRLTCSKRLARSASTPASEGRIADVAADAVRVDALGAVLLVRAPLLRGAAGAGIACELAKNSSIRVIAFLFKCRVSCGMISRLCKTGPVGRSMSDEF